MGGEWPPPLGAAQHSPLGCGLKGYFVEFTCKGEGLKDCVIWEICDGNGG